MGYGLVDIVPFDDTNTKTFLENNTLMIVACLHCSLVEISGISNLNSGLGECDEMCYKDPVLKDRQWSAYIDRSPGSASYSEVKFFLQLTF